MRFFFSSVLLSISFFQVFIAFCYFNTHFGCNHFSSKILKIYFIRFLRIVDILVVVVFSCEYKINRTLVMHAGIPSIVKERIRKNTHLISWSTGIDYVEGKSNLLFKRTRITSAQMTKTHKWPLPVLNAVTLTEGERRIKTKRKKTQY